MKKILFCAALALGSVAISNTTFAQTTVAAPVNKKAPKIEFKKTTHDYGTIANGADGKATFTFKNTGKTPLIISNAASTCGCTVPEWPKQPIAPGKSASITVQYDTKRTGPISKTITVSSNASNASTQQLQIVGTVEAPK